MNKQEYEERIAKLEKELNKLKEVEIVDDEFPRPGEQYWFIDSMGDAFCDAWYNNMIDNYRKDFLRIFKTRKECERYLEIQEAFKEKSKKFEPNWKDTNQSKYCLYYDNYKNSVVIHLVITVQHKTLYFESREVLEELISRFGEEDIKKYYFGIGEF